MRNFRILRAVMLPVSVIALAAGCGDPNGDNGNGNGNGGGNGETYRLSYDGNGHTHGTLPISENHPWDETIVVADPGDLRGADMRDGIKRRFVTWNTAVDGSGDSYAPGGYLYMPEHDVTLYAQWTSGDEILRNVGPGGGLVFIDKGDSTDGWRYMEAAPVSTEWSEAEWGSYGTTIGGTLEVVGAGRENTDIIIAALNAADESGKAAQLCDSLSYAGQSDWFLPSRHELRDLVLELAMNEAVGGIASRNYWSSTEVEGNPHIMAIAFQVGFNAASPQEKNREYYVRAVRRF